MAPSVPRCNPLSTWLDACPFPQPSTAPIYPNHPSSILHQVLEQLTPGHFMSSSPCDLVGEVDGRQFICQLKLLLRVHPGNVVVAGTLRTYSLPSLLSIRPSEMQCVPKTGIPNPKDSASLHQLEREEAVIPTILLFHEASPFPAAIH